MEVCCTSALHTSVGPKPTKMTGRACLGEMWPSFAKYLLASLVTLTKVQSTVTYTLSSFGCVDMRGQLIFPEQSGVLCRHINFDTVIYPLRYHELYVSLYTMFSVIFLQTLELAIIGKCHTVHAALCLSYVHDLTTFQHIITGCSSPIALTCPILSASVKRTRWLLKLVKIKVHELSLSYKSSV